MEIKWKWWTRYLTVAGALALGMQAPLKAESETGREVLSWTLMAARSGEPGQLGVKLRGTDKTMVDAWIDFDGDGYFDDAEERVLDRVMIEPGMSVLPFELPPKAALSASSRIRFRVDGMDGEILMDQEALAFPERIVDPGCNWAPGFGNIGLNDHVYALETFDGALYAGGNLTSVDDTLISWRSARWDGRGWQALTGFEESAGNVLALQAFDDGNGPRLYAGTEFPPYLFRLNGTAWEPIPGILNGAVRALAAWNDGSGPALYVGGSFLDAGSLANADRIARWSPAGGWQALGSGRATHVNTLEVLDLGSGSLLYVGGGNDGTSFVASWNGLDWQAMGNPGEQVYDLEKFGSALHAGGEFGVRSWNGSSWAAVGSFTGTVRSLEVFDAGSGSALYAGGDGFTTAVIFPLGKLARWNGTSWTGLARGMNNSIFALESYTETGAAPALFAGGTFDQTNSAPAGTASNLVVNFIARFDAMGFSSLSSGMNAGVWALEADPPRNQIYAGGRFNRAGGLEALNFARWDGRWHDVYGGTPLYGRDILIDSSSTPETIYVATKGEDSSGQVRKLQGSQWTDLTTSMNDDARALAIYGGKLYVGGSFTSISPSTGAQFQGLAVLNGTTWSAVGTGNTINSEVNALTVFDFGAGPRLVVGGRFSSRVAVWTGSTWSTLPGLNGDVFALAVHDRLDGQGPQLYAAGAGFVARWTGSQWSVFGFVSGTALALQSFSDGTRQLLAAGGDFSAIGGIPYANFAIWDGLGWNAVGGGFNREVWGLATLPSAQGTRLYAGGEFTVASGLSSAYIARLECPRVDFDAAITKTSSVSTPVSIGDPVSYRIEVRNGGPATATGLVVEDIFSGELQGCSWTATGTGGASGQQSGSGNSLRQTLNLPVGAQVTYDIGCTVAPSATGTIDNVATLTAALDTNPGNNQAQVSHTVRPPVTTFDVAITKTSNTTEVSIGEEVGYLVEVRNLGPAAASGVVAEDGFSSELRACRWMAVPFGGATGQQSGSGNALSQTLSLPVGAQVSYVITCTVDVSAQGTIVNTASLLTSDAFPGNNQAQVSHVVRVPTDFDVAITKTSNTTSVSIGEDVVYRIEVLNHGPAAASGVVVEDAFPSTLRNCRWTALSSGATGQQSGNGNRLRQILNLPPAAQVSYDITCAVADSAAGIIDNIAWLAAPGDIHPGNDQARVSHTVLVPIFAFDAAIAMTSSRTIVSTEPGEDTVDYRIEVRNNGPVTATGLKVEDAFPDELEGCGWTADGSGGASGYENGSGTVLGQILNLPPNAKVTYEVTCTFAGSNEGILENRASLPPGDLVPGNNQALVSHVVRLPDTDLYGDCDDSGSVDASDFDAFLSEIFDGDGAYPEFTPTPPFRGNRIGCNANEDGTVDAGDLACLTRKLAGQSCPNDPLPATGLPRLAMQDILVIRNRQIEVPISFRSGQQGINSVAFELHYDASKVDLAAAPNAIRFSDALPSGSVTYTKVDREHDRIELAVRLPRDLSLGGDQLVTLTFDVEPAHLGPTVHRGVTFSPRTAASFGNVKGQSVLGLARVQNAVVRTLVVTHSTRLFEQQDLGFGIDQQRQLNAKLEEFLEHYRVRGLLIDLAADPDLSVLYREWDESGRPEKANEVLFGRPGRRGLHQLLRELEGSFDQVDNLLLIGDDRIVPFARLLDEEEPALGQVTEEDYTNGSVAGGLPEANTSTVKQALAANFFLSDDPLASLESLDLGHVDDEDDFVLPGLGVGRLVENASEILGAFDTFLELDGRLGLEAYDPQDRPVLVAGYDFSTDSARASGDLWRRELGPVAVDSSLLGKDWFAEDLFEAFAESGARLYSLNGHATHDLIGSPDGQPYGGLHGLPALDLYGEDHCGNDPGRAVDLGGAVVIGMSCHGGLPVPGTCKLGTPAESRTLDLAQTFLGRGALAYGDNSGFGWGLLEGIGLGERLAFLIHRRLSGAFLDAPAPNVGTAIHQAKLDYYLQQLEFDRLDRKSLMQWTLYGFPMAELVRPGNLAPPPAPASVFSQREAGDGPLFELPDHMTRMQRRAELSPADYHRVELGAEPGVDPPDSDPCPAAGCYWQWNGLTTDEVGLPMQPFTIHDTTVATTIQRGVLWMGAAYEVELPFHPVIATPVSSQAPTLPPISLPIRTYQQPTGPNGGGYLGDSAGCPGSSATKSQVVLLTGELRKIGPEAWEGRRYRSAEFETLHRSVTAADCVPPVFGAAPFDWVQNGDLHWRVPVSDLESGVWRVIAVWDDQLAQEWKSVDLVRNGGVWEGTLPYDARRESVTYFLQAVDREGNVAWLERAVDVGLAIHRLLEPVVRQIEPPVTTLFADGFESGSCAAWEVNSPGGC